MATLMSTGSHSPLIFPTRQPAQRDTLPPQQQDWRVQSPAIQVMSQDGESGISEGSGSKVRSPNWTDAEVCLLISVWKDYFPISKRQTSIIWERISKQLNQLLAEQNLPCICTAQQCKAKIKNLEDDYKRVKDHNNKSGNERITFPYFDDLNDVLGCKPRITPKKVAECGFDEQASPSSTETGDPNLEEPKNQEDLFFSESLFFKQKLGSKRKGTTESPSVAKKTQTPAKSQRRQRRPIRIQVTSHFFTESQNRDHDFFERLAEKEAERELESQQMMCSMITEIAKIFKRDK